MEEIYYLEKTKKHTSSLKDYYYFTKDKVYDKVKIYKDFECIMKNIYVDIYSHCRSEEFYDATTYLNSYIVKHTNLSLEQQPNPDAKMSLLTVENIYNSIVAEINHHTCKCCRGKSETPICKDCKSKIIHRLNSKLGDKIKDQAKDAVKDFTYEEIEQFAVENEIGWLEKATETARFNVFKFAGEKTISTIKTIALSKAIAAAGVSIIIGGAVGVGITKATTEQEVKIIKDDIDTAHGFQLQKYATITFEGYNGYGYPIIEMDKESLEADILFRNSNKKDDFASQVEVFVNSIEIVPVKETNLSNGNNFIATITYDKEVYEELDIEECDFQIEIPIENLPEAEKINIFDYINLECDGLTGKGTLTINYTDADKEFPELILTSSKSDDLSNKDKVKVTAQIENPMEFVNKYGYVLNSMEQTFVLDGFDYYISSFNEIDSTSWESMEQHAINGLTNYYKGQKYTVDNIEVVDALFATPKDGQSENMVFIICNATITGVTGTVYNIYSYGKISNTIVENGVVNVDYENVYVPDNAYSPGYTPGTLWHEISTDPGGWTQYFGWRAVAYDSAELVAQDLSEIYYDWDFQEIN